MATVCTFLSAWWKEGPGGSGGWDVFLREVLWAPVTCGSQVTFMFDVWNVRKCCLRFQFTVSRGSDIIITVVFTRTSALTAVLVRRTIHLVTSVKMHGMFTLPPEAKRSGIHEHCHEPWCHLEPVAVQQWPGERQRDQNDLKWETPSLGELAELFFDFSVWPTSCYISLRGKVHDRSFSVWRRRKKPKEPEKWGSASFKASEQMTMLLDPEKTVHQCFLFFLLPRCFGIKKLSGYNPIVRHIRTKCSHVAV